MVLSPMMSCASMVGLKILDAGFVVYLEKKSAGYTPVRSENHLIPELDNEARLMEQIVKGDIRCLLWAEELCPSLERVGLRGYLS